MVLYGNPQYRYVGFHGDRGDGDAGGDLTGDAGLRGGPVHAAAAGAEAHVRRHEQEAEGILG